MLCGPPETLMNRTTVPALIVSLLGSNAATLVPLPVILTSTTAPTGWAAGAAAAPPDDAGVAASAWDAAAFFSPPQATTANATSEVNRVNRIADSSGTKMTGQRLVNAFTIYSRAFKTGALENRDRCVFAAPRRH